MNAEQERLAVDAKRIANWKRWGPYLSERQSGDNLVAIQTAGATSVNSPTSTACTKSLDKQTSLSFRPVVFLLYQVTSVYFDAP
jgi:hypothetical protein